MRRLTVLIAVIISLIFQGCLAPKDLRKKKRAIRKIEKAKKLAPSLFTTDTIIVHDTITIDGIIHDTVTNIVYHDSTIIIDNERVFARYFYDTLTKEIYHEVECKEHDVITEKVIIKEKVSGLTLWDQVRLNWIPIAIMLTAFFFLLKKFK